MYKIRLFVSSSNLSPLAEEEEGSGKARGRASLARSDSDSGFSLESVPDSPPHENLSRWKTMPDIVGDLNLRLPDELTREEDRQIRDVLENLDFLDTYYIPEHHYDNDSTDEHEYESIDCIWEDEDEKRSEDHENNDDRDDVDDGNDDHCHEPRLWRTFGTVRLRRNQSRSYHGRTWKTSDSKLPKKVSNRKS